jgi:hypothetical protein
LIYSFSELEDLNLLAIFAGETKTGIINQKISLLKNHKIRKKIPNFFANLLDFFDFLITI